MLPSAWNFEYLQLKSPDYVLLEYEFGQWARVSGGVTVENPIFAGYQHGGRIISTLGSPFGGILRPERMAEFEEQMVDALVSRAVNDSTATSLTEVPLVWLTGQPVNRTRGSPNLIRIGTWHKASLS